MPNNIETKIMDHEQRITNVENSLAQFNTKLIDLEKTVRDEGREQRSLLNRLLDHSLGMEKTKVDNRKEIILAIFGAGGIVALLIGIIPLIIELFSK